MVYVREGIPNKLLKCHTQNNIIENICIELNLKSRKWFLCAIPIEKTLNIVAFIECDIR